MSRAFKMLPIREIDKLYLAIKDWANWSHMDDVWGHWCYN